MISHAKGLLSGIAEEELKSKIAREPFRPIWERMVARWERAAEKDAAEEKIAFQFSCGSSYVTPQLLEAAVIHRLTGDDRALAYVHRQIDKLAKIWSDPPQSLHEHAGGRTTYFSDAEACLAAEICRDALDADRYQTLLRLARDYFIDDNDGDRQILGYSAGHNIPLTRVVTAGICALVLGEESGHPDWERVVDLATDACKLYCRWGLDETGMPYEATMYGAIVIDWIFRFAEQLRANGRVNLFETIPVLRRIPDTIAGTLFPDRGGIINTGDSHQLVTSLPMPWLLLTARHFNRPRDLALWHEMQSAVPPERRSGDLLTLLWWDGALPPPLTDFALPTAYYGAGTATAAFRTSWSNDATFLNVLGQGRSHASHGHPHADVGHVTIMTAGEQLAIDNGYWNYNEDQHSTVMVEHRGLADSPEGWYGLQPYAGRIERFQRHALLDYVLVDGKAAKHCIWADRHALFVRLGGDDAYIVLIDNINRDNAKHRYLWQLQAHPESIIELTGKTTATIRREKSRLDCTFINPLPEDFPGDPHVLNLRADIKLGAEPEGSKASHPRLLAEQSGLNCQLLAVLVPRHAGAPALTVRNATVRRTFRVEIDCGDFTDTLIAGLDHAYLRFPDVQGMTELALIRRDRAGNVLDYWTADGEPLTFRETTLPGYFTNELPDRQRNIRNGMV